MKITAAGYVPPKQLLRNLLNRPATNYFRLVIIISALICHTTSLLAQHDIPATNEFVITGSVNREYKFSLNNLAPWKQESLGNLALRNKKGEQKGEANNAKGILLKSILDSAGISVDKPKDYSRLAIILRASDGYSNIYTWNELFNTDIGNHVFVVTEMNGLPATDMQGRIMLVSLADINTGNRHLKGVTKIEVLKIQ